MRFTFTERHLILMVITSESLQNLQNIVNAVVIKVDCVKECLSSITVYPLQKTAAAVFFKDYFLGVLFPLIYSDSR